MSGYAWALLLLLSTLWGCSFYFVEIALPAVQPLALVWLRVGGAAVLLAVFLAARGGGMARFAAIGRRWRLYALLSVFGNVLPFSSFAWGQQYITSGMAGVLNATTPLFTLALALAVGEEKFSPPRALGLLLGLTGVAVLLQPGMDAGFWTVAGMLACLGAACSYGVVAIVGRRRATAYAPLENAFGQLAAATLILTPFALWQRPWAGEWTWPAGAAMAGLAFFSTFCAYLVYFRLLAAAGAVNAMLVTFFIPVFAIGLGVMLLGERFSAPFYYGAAMVLASLVVADSRLRGRFLSAFGVKRRGAL